MDRPVADQPDVGPEQFLIALKQRSEVAGPGLFLALEEELQIRARREPGSAQCVERGDHRHDRALVVAGAPREEPRFGVELSPLGDVHHGADRAVRRRAGPEGREPGRGHPLARVDRLAVVMGVEHHRPSCPRHHQLAVDRRRVGPILEDPSGDAALLEHGLDQVGVAANVGPVGGDVGDGEECREFADNLRFVLNPPGADRRYDRLGRHGPREGGGAQDAGDRRGERPETGGLTHEGVAFLLTGFDAVALPVIYMALYNDMSSFLT